jgi:hypothetical protein
VNKSQYNALYLSLQDQDWQEGITWYNDTKPQHLTSVYNKLIALSDEDYIELLSNYPEIMQLVRTLSILAFKELAYRSNLREIEDNE